jgi:signal transduction histidine kinase
MTIRTRLTFWYAGILILSLLVMGIGTYQEIFEQLRHEHWRRPEERATNDPGGMEVRHEHRSPEDHALNETGEMVFRAGLPAIVLGLLGGWWLTRRALAPVARLTAAVEKIHEHNLNTPLPRSGSGDELDRLTEVFNAMAARLDGSFTRIREFTLHASHELKTPLTILCGETETLLRDESLTPNERDRAVSQLDELRRLARIVDGLTLLAKADAGQIVLTREPVPWDELIRDNFADALILAEPHGIGVELGACEAMLVCGDRHRLRQLLLNLTDNAVKYNQPHGKVLMTLRRWDGLAEYTISNTGPGIPPELLPRVFDRFFRGNAAHDSTVEGCGLGLSIAQWIVTAHHGTITLESPAPGRTLVRVRLPIFTPPA